MRLKSTSGVNINFLNTFLTILTGVVFCFILLISNSVNKRFDAVRRTITKFIVCEQSSKDIKESANYLTEKAQQFVVSLNPSYAESFIEEITVKRSQDRALESLMEVCSEKDLALQRLKIALSQADSLNEMELYSIRLAYESIAKDPTRESAVKIPESVSGISLRPDDSALSAEEMHARAISNLFESGFLLYRTRVNENCNLTIRAIEQQIEDELGANADELGENLQRLQMLFCLLLIVTTLIFVALAFLVINPLKKFQISIRNDEKLKMIGSSEFKSLAQSYNEIYDMKAKNEKTLLIKAEYDALTGILNRRAFDQICQSSAEKKQSIALLLIDMDNFKHINDTYGHQGGDTALKELARLLKETFRKDDYVARIGGDEFAAILQDFNPSAENRILEKVEEINVALSNMKDGIKPVSISVGAAYSATGYSERLYRSADKALYEVKENGRRGCRIYDAMLDF